MTPRRATLLAAVLALHACRERDRGNNATSTNAPTVVPTTVAPQPMPPPPIMPAPNALADAAVAPPPAAPPVPPMAAAPDAAAPAAPAAPTEPAAPATAQRTRDPAAAPLEIPSPIQGVPGVRVRRNRNNTGINVGGVQINLPAQ